jgi:hypothetical protein
MIRGVSYSRWSAAVSAAGIGAALLAVLIHNHDVRSRSARLSEVAGRESDLLAQIGAKSGFDQTSMDALRAKVNRFRVRLGPEGSWDRAVRLMGKAWAAFAEPRDDREGFSVQTGTFRLESPATDDWPQIVEAVKGLEQIPGVGVIGFEMRTSGDRERRSVDLVKVLVAVQTLRSAQSQEIK